MGEIVVCIEVRLPAATHAGDDWTSGNHVGTCQFVGNNTLNCYRLCYLIGNQKSVKISITSMVSNNPLI